MTQNLSGGKLIILKNDGVTEKIAYLPKNKRVINIGSDITCDIRIYLPGIRQFHFKITSDQIGKPKVTNLSAVHPITVNDEVITDKYILKSGDVIGVLGKKFRWENKLEVKRKSVESLPGIRKSRNSIYKKYITTQRRITIYSICQSEKKKYTDVVIDHTDNELELDQLKMKSDKSTTITKPKELDTSSPSKENISSTPKTPKLDFLNRSETLITSYCVLKSFSTPTKCCMTSNILTPGSMNRHNSFITSSISNELESPQKIFVEKSHNSIDLNPVHVQKKSMYLIDLTTPFVKNSRHSNRSHVTSTPKISENNSISTRKDNNLLKSAIKNSNVKKRRAGRSIKLPSSIAKSVVKTISSTHAESPLFLSCCDTSPVIEVNETLDDTFESFSPSIKEECKIVISSQNSNDTEKSPEVRNQKYDSKDVSGIIELMKSPKYHTSKILDEPTSSNTFIKSEQMDSDEDGIRELLTSISSVLEDSKDISIETLDLCKELPPISINISEEPPTDNTECLESEKLVYVIEPEFKTMDRSFDELIGIPTITKTYNRKSSLFVQDKADEESTIEMKLKEKECGERVIKWIEDVKASGSLEISNKTKQIISSRYSNVTPNDSLVDSTSLNKTSYAADQTIIGNYSPRLSILETMEHLKQDKFEDSQINQKLTISPVSRLSIIVNSTEVLENYHLQKNHEIPNSLRSTRKKFGMAFASLHNVSAQATEDLNESINNSIHSYNDGMKEDEESKSSSPNILSLDDYQRKTDDEMCHKTNRQSLLYNSYIEFVKTDDCDERSEDDDVFEISDSIQSSDASIESDQSSEHECDNESSSEILFIDESERRLIDKTSDDLFDDIKPIKSSSEDDDEPVETTRKIIAPTVEDNISDSFQELTENEILQNELKNVADTPVIAKRGVSLAPQVEPVAIAKTERKTIVPTAEDMISDSFQELIEKEILQNELKDVAETPGIAKRGVSLAPQVEPVAKSTRKTIASTVEDMISDSFQELVENEILQNELKYVAETPVIAKRGVSLAPQVEPVAKSTRKTIASTAEDMISDSFQELVENEILQNEIKYVAVTSVIAKRGVSLAPQVEPVAKTTRKTIASTAEDMISDSFQELVENEILQNELKYVAETPVITKRGMSLAPQVGTVAIVKSTRKTIASTVEDMISDSFQELVENEILQNELKYVAETPVIAKRCMSLSPQVEPVAIVKSTRITIASTVEDNISDSFQELTENEILQNEIKYVAETPVITKRGVSLAPQVGTVAIVKSTRKTIASTAEDMISDSFQELVENEILQNELKYVAETPVIAKRCMSLAPQVEPVAIVKSTRKTIASTVEDNISDSFQELTENEILQNEIKYVSETPVIAKRGGSLEPQVEPVAIAKTERKTIVPTAEDMISDSFQELIEKEILQNELKDVAETPGIAKKDISLAPQVEPVAIAEDKISLSFQELIGKEILQNELKDVAETVIAKRGVNHTPQFSSTEKLTKNISATNESLNVLVVENDQISTMDDIIIDTSENGVQKKKELFVIEVPEDFPELKIPKIEETLNLSFSVIANSTAKESVEQDKLLHSATDAVAIKRTRGIKVNYLEMVTRSTLKSSTPQKSAKNYEEESRKTQIKTPLNRKLLKISTQIDEIRERELELSIETINNDKESSKVEVLKVAVPKITRGRKKTVKNVENELAFEKNVAEQETVTTDKLRTGTPKKRRLKTVKDVEAIPVVTKKIDLAEAELDQEEEFRMDVKISGHNKLNTEVPRRGRKKTVKGVETKPVVSKKKDLVKTELEHGEVEESQMADDIAETPRRGRKKMVKDVETKPVVLKKVDLDDIEQEKATEIRVTKKRKAELVKYAEMVTTDIIPKRRLRGAKNKDDGEPDTVKETTTKIASNKVDLAEVEIKELIVEESQMKKKVAKQKAVTINNSTAETPKRGRKKTVKDVETKPVVSKKKDLVETELEHGEVEESQMAEDIAETPRRGRKKMVKDVETKPVVLKKVDLDDIEQEKATEIRVTKKRKAEPVKYAEMVTTDIIPKRRLRGAKNKEDGEPDTVKETTTKIESAEPNSLKRKIIPTTTETEVVTVVKKSRVKSIKVIEEPFANEKIVLQNILGKNTDPKSSEVAQKVVLSTEVKRSTRRKN